MGDSVPEVCAGGWPHRQPLPNTEQNSRLPEEKQAVGRTTVFIQTMWAGGATHVSYSLVRILPNPRSSDTSRGACLASRPF